MSFAADIRRFTDKTEKSVDKTVRAITFALFREVIQRTPVLDGFLKGAWQTTTRAPATVNITRADPSGARAITEVVTNGGGWGSVTYMSNLMPYAHRIEWDGWSSVKAPSGMVRISFARIQTIVANAARQNKV